MKRFVISALVLILAMSAFAAALAEPAQIATGDVQSDLEGEIVVQTTVDLSDNWSVWFMPSTVYVYDHVFNPAELGKVDYAAFISFCSKEDYEATLAEWTEAGTEYEEKGDFVAGPYMDEMTEYLKPVDEDTYLDVFVFNTVDADAVLARISCAKVENE